MPDYESDVEQSCNSKSWFRNLKGDLTAHLGIDPNFYYFHCLSYLNTKAYVSSNGSEAVAVALFEFPSIVETYDSSHNNELQCTQLLKYLTLLLCYRGLVT